MSGEHIMKVGQQQRKTAVLLVPLPISSAPDKGSDYVNLNYLSAFLNACT